jgi:hypothetical protein
VLTVDSNEVGNQQKGAKVAQVEEDANAEEAQQDHTQGGAIGGGGGVGGTQRKAP